jgi:hypothetical protein
MKWPVTLALALVLAVLQLTAATAASNQPAAANARNHAASHLENSGPSDASSSAAASAAAPQQQQHMQTPLICTAMLSYNRPHYLVPAVRAFVAYMVAVEPDITWTLQVLDNGSGPEALGNITQQLAPLRAAGHAVRLVHLERNIGLSRGFNVLFFDMCASTGAPYILSLEDDWRARSEQWSAGFPVLQASMQALKRHDSLLEVWLRDHHQKFIFNKPAEWQLENFTLPAANSLTATPGQQLQLNVLHLTCINERGNPWGGYSNGASLKHALRLRALGHMPGTDGEAAISKRSCRKGYHVAYICQDTSCFEPVKQWHDGLFEHLGTARVPASMDARSNKAAVARKVSKDAFVVVSRRSSSMTGCLSTWGKPGFLQAWMPGATKQK